MVYNPVDVFGLSCPEGGAFFVCESCDVHFLGCCASDPGKDGSGYCPDEDVRYSSFKTERGANITDQECLDPKGDWYTCFDLDRPFLGCCSSNACETECPPEDVVGAKLSDNPKSAAPFRKSPPVTTWTATSTSSASTGPSPSTSSEPPTASSTVDISTPPVTSSLSTSSGVSSPSVTSTSPTTTSGQNTTATTAASSSASAGTPENPQGSSSSGLSRGATAGVSVGATLVLLFLAAAVLFFARRSWRKRRGVVVRGSEPPTHSAMVLPTSAPNVSRTTNHIVQTPSHSPSQSQSQSHSSSTPSLNNGQRPVLYVVNRSSRQSSVSSNNSNNMAGPSPPSGQNSWPGVAAPSSTAQRGVDQHSNNQPLNHHSERLAELDGVGRPIPELPATSPAPHPPVVYRPYRPPPRASQRGYRGADQEMQCEVRRS